MDEQFQNDNMPTSTSEVRSVPPRETMCNESDGVDKWRSLLEQQIQNFLALIQTMKASTESTDITVPKFDPKKVEVDARSWINMDNMCMLNQPLQGAALIIALSEALKGSASAWLAQVSFPGMTWSHMFISRYDCPETTAACLINLHNEKPKEGGSLAAYAARLMTSLMATFTPYDLNWSWTKLGLVSYKKKHAYTAAD